MSDIDDLLNDVLGPPPAPAAIPEKRLPGRPRKDGKPPIQRKAPPPAPLLPHATEDEFNPNAAMPDAAAFRRPVGITFLATVLGTEPRRLAGKLSRCPVLGYEMHKGVQVAVYDFKTAIAYCVEPKIDVATWIKSQTTASLPPHISKGYWDAMNAKQKWQERAGDLWHTADVLEVFGGVFMAIKETAQLWIENLPGKATMSNEQYVALNNMVAELQNDLHQRLVEMPKQHRTESSLRDLDEEIEAADAKALRVAAG